MEKIKKFYELADEQSLNNTINALKEKWIESFVLDNWLWAKNKVIDLIPKGEEVMNMTSETLVWIWLDKEILDSWIYKPVRKVLMDDKFDWMTKKRVWTAHKWAIWSIHAITEDWNILIASATWSQLPSYAYWAENIIFVVWTQKIVKDIDEWMRRIYEYTFPLENERAMKAYWTWSWVNKILIINKETVPWRIKLIFVKEKLWF